MVGLRHLIWVENRTCSSSSTRVRTYGLGAAPSARHAAECALMVGVEVLDRHRCGPPIGRNHESHGTGAVRIFISWMEGYDKARGGHWPRAIYRMMTTCRPSYLHSRELIA